MKNVPNVPGVSLEGNSISSNLSPVLDMKKISPAKKWCFVMNNYEKCSISSIFSCLTDGDDCIIGREVGEKGTPHLQGFVEFSKKVRPLSVIKVDGIHWIKCKGTRAQNIKYCSKDGKYQIFGKIKVKKPVKILKEEELYNWERDIVDILGDEPDDRTIYWYTDDGACNTGKTTFGKYLVVKYGAIILGGKSADMKNGIIDYVKKNGDTPEIIIVNLPKTFDTNYLSYTGIEECKDMLFYSGKFEGGMVCGNCPHFIVFSNEYPDWDKVDHKRWKVFNVILNKWITYEEHKAMCDIKCELD
jgi:hypothetical protein